jgi:peptide-methionine (S)-S-oxide reductase
MEKATFGAGCFWGVQARFEQEPGVVETAAGYEGGSLDNPTYKDVCSDHTGHAEVVELTFDPQKVSYVALLDLFFELHDPTQVNRQGPDVGSQYRTVIFAADEEQRTAAEGSRERVQQKLGRPVATQIEDEQPFWEAEDYHQQYLEKRGLASCTPRLAAVS